MQTNLESKTVQQAIETIRERVDSLGVSEPVIQEYSLGANQILVELPGVDDLDRVKNIIQSTARLEIHAVVGRQRLPRRAGGLASVSGTIPPDQMMVHGSGDHGFRLRLGQVYILQRVSVVAGSDFRSADPSTNQNTGQRSVTFTLTNEAGDKFYDYTSPTLAAHGRGAGRPGARSCRSSRARFATRAKLRARSPRTRCWCLSKMLRTGALPASLEYLEEPHGGRIAGR